MDILGKEDNLLQKLNIKHIFLTLEVFHFDISGNEYNYGCDISKLLELYNKINEDNNNEINEESNTNNKDNNKIVDLYEEMNSMFSECKSLISLPDLSKWNTSNVTDMKAMFWECNSLISLPDISKWDTSNVTAMNHMFFGCRSLISLPDISKWNTSKVSDKKFMFYEAINILNIYP